MLVEFDSHHSIIKSSFFYHLQKDYFFLNMVAFLFFFFFLRAKKKKDQRERSRERSSRDKESKSSKKKHKEARSGADKEERVASSSAFSNSLSSSNKAENARVTRDYDEEEKGYVSGEGKSEKVYGAAAPPADVTPPGSGSMEDNLESAVPSSMGDQMTSDTNLQQMDMDMSD